ncbi:tripartite tricarboxylate transporter substrate binding protein [Xylophilus sp. GOD-11R]|uniref:Bug family tripartite tricarboxylate transporter substrate binding protein n=1 Tax=Xylophilus sp. GOD-11R TaxID=3089814 RepID=UPI00298C8451|nr:tripartite tricarboxylate transporter substrate binding protein [Xylophilus sp. GOD-11R]WPB55523.1 tripartite tricarboxylate transporter substrate binding protein [Xylophilus sp. GOD-11R]
MNPALASRRSALAAMACGLLPFAAPTAHAQGNGPQGYPNKPVRIVVPFAPGGGGDAVVRNIVEKLGERLGQQVIIDNKPGASGYIGAQLVTSAIPDGYTLLMGFDGSLVVAPNMIKAPFDASTDFAPVTKLNDASLIIAVNPALGVRNLKELIEVSKTRPGGVQFGSSGAGTTTHLAGELLAIRSGMKVTHVPYKGGGQAVTDVVSGQLPMIITVIPTIAGFIQDQRLVPIAVTGPRRSSSLPDVPTVSESGVRDFDVTSWYGILAPAKTPAAITHYLQKEIAAVLALPEVRERYAKGGFEPVGNTPEQFAVQIKDDLARWGKVVKDASIRVD